MGGGGVTTSGSVQEQSRGSWGCGLGVIKLTAGLDGLEDLFQP